MRWRELFEETTKAHYFITFRTGQSCEPTLAFDGKEAADNALKYFDMDYRTFTNPQIGEYFKDDQVLTDMMVNEYLNISEDGDGFFNNLQVTLLDKGFFRHLGIDDDGEVIEEGQADDHSWDD